MATPSRTPETRRNFLRHSAALTATAAFAGLSTKGVWAAGSDGPEKTEVKIGFIPLTDCASIVMASVLGFDKKHGVTIVPSKEANWATVRDKLIHGENDLSHILYGELYGIELGVGGPKKDMAVLMTLNQNGQGISFSKKLSDQGITSLAQLKTGMQKDKREYTFAQTFPTGTHAMWLNYWMASGGINPVHDIRSIVIPPPQMVANVRVGNMDGFSVGEPWNARGIMDGVSVSVASSQDIWPNHPEKVLGTTAEFADKYPNTCRAVMAAILEASRWIDSSISNKQKMAETIAGKAYVNTSTNVIIDRILGRYQNGLGKTWDDPNHMRFHADGAVNFPYLSDGMWFLTQHKRWGLLKQHPDYLAVAKKVNRIALYQDAATATKVAVTKDPMRSSKLIDGVIWNGGDPAKYADSFAVKA